MDWYVGCAVDDLTVPSNQDMLDMFPSSSNSCCSDWELFSSKAFDPMNKSFVSQTNFTGSGLNFNGKSQNKFKFEYQQDEPSISSNFYQEFIKGSVNQDTSACDVSDYQLDDLDMTNQTDDVLLTSAHDISSDTYNNPEFENDEFGVFSSEGLFENMIIGSKCGPSHLSGMRSSKHLKTHAPPPFSGGGDRLLKDDAPSQAKVQYEETMDEQINKKTSEASILQELEKTISQMSDHTRICLRDAMYRLAENSRQQPVNLSVEINYRSVNAKTREVETNTIDRAVAHLMFYKRDSDVQNLL